MSAWKIVGIGILLFIGLPILFFGLRLVGLPFWFANRTLTVAKQEADPAELLRKYSWFKEAKAVLESRQAGISVLASRTRGMNGQKLDRTDRERLMVWEQEQAGMVLSYNALAAEYNAKMAEIHWAFTNVGKLPAGASEPLPREFAPYPD